LAATCLPVKQARVLLYAKRLLLHNAVSAVQDPAGRNLLLIRFKEHTFSVLMQRCRCQPKLEHGAAHEAGSRDSYKPQRAQHAQHISVKQVAATVVLAELNMRSLKHFWWQQTIDFWNALASAPASCLLFGMP